MTGNQLIVLALANVLVEEDLYDLVNKQTGFALALDELRDLGLICETSITPTPKGRCFLTHVMSLPLPTQNWRML